MMVCVSFWVWRSEWLGTGSAGSMPVIAGHGMFCVGSWLVPWLVPGWFYFLELVLWFHGTGQI